MLGHDLFEVAPLFIAFAFFLFTLALLFLGKPSSGFGFARQLSLGVTRFLVVFEQRRAANCSRQRIKSGPFF